MFPEPIPPEALPQWLTEHVPTLRALDRLPAACVVENDSPTRNRLLTAIAQHAASAGDRVIFAQQSPHDTFEVATVPEYQAIAEMLRIMRRLRQQAIGTQRILFVLPRLELPLTDTLGLLRDLRQTPTAWAVVGANSVATGPSIDFAPGFYPCDFPVLWRNGHLAGRCQRLQVA